VLCNAALTDAMVRSARLGCALELYRRTHGVYPEKLDALVPGFLPALPAPVWKGAPVAYARTAKGGYALTWPKGDKSAGLAVLNVEHTHPGPWEIFGESVELPATWRFLDSRKVTRATATPRDLVWEMDPPPERK
jgi:hypothetical protein